MTAARAAVFWWVGAGALALALGVVAAREPLLLVVAAAVGALGWSLLDARRLNYALLAVLFLVPVTADPGYPISPVWTVLLAATVVGFVVRRRVARLGWVMLIMGPLLALVMAPGFLLDYVRVDRQGFDARYGFWFAPRVFHIKFADLRQEMEALRRQLQPAMPAEPRR